MQQNTYPTEWEGGTHIGCIKTLKNGRGYEVVFTISNEKGQKPTYETKSFRTSQFGTNAKIKAEEWRDQQSIDIVILIKIQLKFNLHKIKQ
jgi:hypothetical protein